MRLIARPLLAALLLTGCLGPGFGLRMGPVDEMLRPRPDGDCGLSELPDLQGQEMARLADFRLIGPLRVLWPGQEITNEIDPSRLNAEVDVTGRILRMMCG
ncbi:MAG: hypothetical protein K9G43_08925 [Rhodobacteraceae bacterium]|nr:hypothetical protein [Paracoccaceae bacterium]